MEAFMNSSTNIRLQSEAATRIVDGLGLTGERQNKAVSCVIPCFNEGVNLRQLLPRLEEILWATNLRWEIIVVDDGSTDDTEEVARAWCELPGFRCISLSRNFGKEAALTAGLAAATGDAVVLLDGDLQHSPGLIQKMIAQWLAGAEVVYAVREARTDESRFKQFGSSLFYRLLDTSDRFAVPKDAGDFRLMDRKVVDALMSLSERSRFMKGLYAWVGFRAVAIPYTPAPRAQGVSTFNAQRLVRLAIDGLTAFTTWPLRMVSVVGLMFALSAIGYGLYVTIDYLLFGNAVSGWTTIVVSLMFFIGVQMISTGIVGEYIARIYEEVKGRPLYVVSREHGTGLKNGTP
ncbi:glycosyltransferase family 2 protein [Variovorax sp. J22G21]|uniref:glycosyltransferase family 2 protein n=1 Tax=Variovorax fucosicus TaxID=3053517 RepID=UPI0025769271|nr:MULTISPECIES: glycosyltransferase family 2 protein [unclassified Variovorax]MDM0038963.1 glycosyltransferase family 2 protein [Variovorax sp. J22R193]MDM0063739.1 glycosyltransferase family 2 protein [Variovorax sp. J22G21]